MKILYTGTDKRCKEFEEKFAPLDIELIRFNFSDFESINLKIFDAIFDLEFDDHIHRFETYSKILGVPILLSATKICLLKQSVMYTPSNESLIFGFVAIPSFINRATWEITCLGVPSKEYIKHLARNLQTQLIEVVDRVGMVTPRVICMIINEAFYTLQEGTANKEDINKAMKLGTNHPYGPFEWADKMGIRQVIETLEAMYDDTHDERYRICPLMKTEYLAYLALKTSLKN